LNDAIVIIQIFQIFTFFVGLEKILLSLAIYTQPSKMSGNWLDLSSSSNRYIQTYMKGFLDMSGGNLLLRNNNIIVAAGDISLNGRFFVNGDTSMNGRLFVSKDLSLNSRLFVGSDVSLNGNVYARGTIITDASSYTDVKGGFIVENNVNVTGIINQSTINLSGGYIYLPSNVTTEQYNSLVGALTAVNNVIQTATAPGLPSTVGGGTVVKLGLPPYAGGPNIMAQTMADTWVSGNLLVAGSTTVNTNQVTGGPGSLYVAGSVNVPNGNLIVGGNVSLLNNTLNMAIGNITLTGGNVTLNNGYIQTSGNIMTTAGTVHSANDISVNGLVFGKGPGGNNIVLGSNLLSTANGYTINNLALGKNSLTSISNNGVGTYGAFGSNNTTVGFSAGSGITTGNYNTAVGSNSGSGVTTGNNNTFLGGNTTTSSGAFVQSTAVGFGATIGGSNQIVLGTTAESVIVSGNVGIGRTGVPTYSLDVSGTINARGEIISSGCYFSQQYTYTTTAAGTVYLKIGSIWGNFTEHVLTQYSSGYTGSLRIIVDCAQQGGTFLTNTPIQLISSIGSFSCLITNVFIVQPVAGGVGTAGELWIQVTTISSGQIIVHSWRSMAAMDHASNQGTAIGTQSSTSMPPLTTTTTPATATDYNLIATYTPNSATNSGGATAFMGQKVGLGIAAPTYTLDVSGTGRFTSDLSINGNVFVKGNIGIGTTAPAYQLDVAGVIRSNNLPKYWNYMRLYPAGVTANTYFLLGTIGDWGNSGNGGAISIKGFIGGWGSIHKATVDINISTRGSSSTPNIEGTFYCTSTLSTIIGFTDILIYYLNGGGSASTPQFYVYLLTKVTVPHFDLTITGNDQKNTSVVLAEPAQGTTTAPTGGTTIVSSVLSVLKTYTVAGNVGIGQSAPAYQLDVSGTGRFTSDVSINGNLVVGNLLVKGGLTVEQMQSKTIINTTTSNYQLIVTEDISLNGRLFVSGNTTNGPPLNSGAVYTPSTGNANAFHSFIGNTSPGQVNPIMAIYNNYATSSTAINDPTPILALRRGGTSVTCWDAAANFNISRYLNSNSEARSRLDIALANGNSSSPDTNIMTLLGNGNVGIGTTTPGSTLNLVNGTTTNTNPILGIQGYNGGASGTADTVRQPMINMFRSGTGGVQNSVSAQINLGSHAAVINNYSTIDFKLGGAPGAGNNYGNTPDVNVMTLTGQGYVGIGTIAPPSRLTIKNGYNDGIVGGLCLNADDGANYRLHLSSYVQASNQVAYLFQVNNRDTTSTSLAFGYNGAVGIGTTAPAYPLDLTGNGRVNGNIFLGTAVNNPQTQREHLITGTNDFGVNSSSSMTTVYSKNIRIKSPDFLGSFWNNTNGFSNTPTAYAGSLYLQAGDLDNTADNGTAAANMFGGSIYLQSGSAYWGGTTPNGINHGDIIFSSGTGTNTNTKVERMRIVGNTGNVGLGTTNPVSTLDVSGTVSLSTGSSSNTYKNLYGKAAPTSVYGNLVVSPNSKVATTTTWVNNNITWTSSVSSIFPAGGPWSSNLAFNTTFAAGTDKWESANTTYTSGLANSTAALTSNIFGQSAQRGEWLQIQSSNPVVMTSYSLASHDSQTRLPKTFWIVGSNDGNNWFQIQAASCGATQYSPATYTMSSTFLVNSASAQPSTGGATLTTTINPPYTTSAFTYFRLICLSIFSTTETLVDIGEWLINFSLAQTGPSRALLYMDPSNINQMDVSGSLALINTNPSTMTVTPNTTGAALGGWQNNNVTWVARASSTYSLGTSPFCAFNSSTAPGGWFASTVLYTVATGLYNGSVTPTTVTGIGSGVSGEWLELTSSVPVVLNSYFMTTVAGTTCSRCPASFTIAGSNDGVTWNAIQNVNTTALPSYFSTSSTAQQITARFNVSNNPTTPQNNATITGYSTASNAYTYFRIFTQLTFGTRFSISSVQSDGFLSFGFVPVFTPVTSSVSMALDNGLPNQLNVGGAMNVAGSLSVNGYISGAMPQVVLSCNTHISTVVNNHQINWTSAPNNNSNMWSSTFPNRITAPIRGWYYFTFKSHGVFPSNGNTSFYSVCFSVAHYNSSSVAIIPFNSAPGTSAYVFGCENAPQSGNGDIHFTGTLMTYMNAGEYLLVSEAANQSVNCQWNYNGSWTCGWGICMMAV
jgi:hypothetical protein